MSNVDYIIQEILFLAVPSVIQGKKMKIEVDPKSRTVFLMS